MDPETAINLIDQVASQYQGTRQDHTNLQMAVTVLRDLVDQRQAAEEKSDKADTPKSPRSV